MREWLARKLHRCHPPDVHEVAPVADRPWVCPTCKTLWRLEQWHVEDRVHMGGADADIGYDVVGWVKQ
jgi:hypothetical protein